ncbi:MAG: hypothetical protein ACI9G1_000450 [Pirellulaceae bacterium]|jgi:hypothetical protein
MKESTMEGLTLADTAANRAIDKLFLFEFLPLANISVHSRFPVLHENLTSTGRLRDRRDL